MDLVLIPRLSAAAQFREARSGVKQTDALSQKVRCPGSDTSRNTPAQLRDLEAHKATAAFAGSSSVMPHEAVKTFDGTVLHCGFRKRQWYPCLIRLHLSLAGVRSPSSGGKRFSQPHGAQLRLASHEGMMASTAWNCTGKLAASRHKLWITPASQRARANRLSKPT